MTVEIEAILFDVGGTLRNTSKRSRDEKRALLSQLMALIGADGDILAFSRRIRRRYTSYRVWAQETLTERNEADLWTQWILPEYPEHLIRKNAVQLNQLYREASGTRKVDPLTREVAIELFRRGYRLGIVSNTTSSVEVPALLKELGIPGCFETIILSAVVGKRKPNPDILLDATRRMGVQPGRCAYIGDRPERDVAAGRRAGFAQTILIRNGTTADREMNPEDVIPDHTIDSLDQLLELFPTRNGSQTVPQPTPPVYDVAFSTMWMRKNVPNLQDFFVASRRLGFKKIELNHQMNSSLLAEGELQMMEISSIHEPCPADIPLDTLKDRDWLISALDEENRLQGVNAVRRSIDLASQVGAEYIVVHAGATNSDRHLEKRLRALYEQGKSGSGEFLELVAEMRTERQALSSGHFDSVLKSIRELLDYAAPRKVRLGIENRYHYLEFPSPDELEILLSMGGEDTIGFVLDVGHAYTLDRLGFYPFQEWLERFSTRIIGTHLHDVVGLTDHFAPGLGEVNFDLVAAYLPVEANRTCEFQVFNNFEQVKAGLKYLHSHHCIKITNQ